MSPRARDSQALYRNGRLLIAIVALLAMVLSVLVVTQSSPKAVAQSQTVATSDYELSNFKTDTAEGKYENNKVVRFSFDWKALGTNGQVKPGTSFEVQIPENFVLNQAEYGAGKTFEYCQVKDSRTLVCTPPVKEVNGSPEIGVGGKVELVTFGKVRSANPNDEIKVRDGQEYKVVTISTPEIIGHDRISAQTGKGGEFDEYGEMSWSVWVGREQFKDQIVIKDSLRGSENPHTYVVDARNVIVYGEYWHENGRAHNYFYAEGPDNQPKFDFSADRKDMTVTIPKPKDGWDAVCKKVNKEKGEACGLRIFYKTFPEVAPGGTVANGAQFTNTVSINEGPAKTGVATYNSGMAWQNGSPVGSYSLNKKVEAADNSCTPAQIEEAKKVPFKLNFEINTPQPFDFAKTKEFKKDGAKVAQDQKSITYSENISDGMAIRGYDALPLNSTVTVTEKLPTNQSFKITPEFTKSQWENKVEIHDGGTKAKVTINPESAPNVRFTLVNKVSCPSDPPPTTSSLVSTTPENPTTSDTSSASTTPETPTTSETSSASTTPVSTTSVTTSESTTSAASSESTSTSATTSSELTPKNDKLKWTLIGLVVAAPFIGWLVSKIPGLKMPAVPAPGAPTPGAPVAPIDPGAPVTPAPGGQREQIQSVPSGATVKSGKVAAFIG